MKVYYVKDRSVVYILSAVLCLTLIFLGVKIIGDKSPEETTQTTIDVVEVFSDTNGEKNIEANTEENTDKEIIEKSIERPNLLMVVLSKSNTFIRSLYEDEYNDNNLLAHIRDTYLRGLEINNQIVKSQLPAIMSMSDIDKADLGPKLSLASRGSSNDTPYEELETFSELEVESSYSPLGSIVFVDDNTPEVVPTATTGVSREEAITAIESMAKPKTISVAKNKPYVMLYHTHTTEAYLPDTDFRGQDRKYNVLAIGDIIEEELKKRGHGITHIEKFHDLPSYTGSYGRSLASIKENLNKESNLKVLIDIHRDGVDSGASYYDRMKKESVIEINGKRAATFKFVVGNDTPNRPQIVQFSNYIKTVSDMLYPGLCLKPVMKPYGKFNQYFSDYTLLIEVGSNLNTIDETKETARLIAEILDVALKGITK